MDRPANALEAASMDPDTTTQPDENLRDLILLAREQRWRSLTLTGRGLRTLPREIGALRYLEELDINYNELTELPSEVTSLVNLRVLRAHGNRLSGLPAQIGDLSALEELFLHSNSLTELPDGIGKLWRLRLLSVSGNCLSEFPRTFVGLTSLSELRADHNNLGVLPTELASLTELTVISLASNQLTRLPDGLGSLRRLRVLELDDNHLENIPHDTFSIRTLERLSIANNRISQLPDRIGGADALVQFNAAHNQISTVPREIGGACRLEDLSLAGNRLDAVPPELCRLTRLRRLNLAHNRLKHLPHRISKLICLLELDASHNEIERISPEVLQLKDLRLLDLSHNRLRSIPPEIADLPSLHDLKLDGNPIPFQELLSRGTEAVKTYLRSLEDAIPHYEAKMLLVGEGNVGKTSLLAALRDEPFVENRATTHGIQIGTLNLSHPTIATDMSLNAWDFGGQEVYRITHQFFFSQRSLYVLVWKPREGQEENSVEGWLRRIRLRVNDARILIVATHCSERHAELDFPYLRSVFGKILSGSLEVDSKSREGIGQVERSIAEQAAELPQMGELWSPRWITARNEILKVQHPQVMRSEFNAICRTAKLRDDEIPTFIALLHDLGHIIYYGEDEGLRDIVVLQPEWITRAIGFVLEDRSTIVAKGVLDHKRLRHIWYEHGIQGRESYSPEHHPYFLRLMEKFDISYRVPDSDESLVAQLVPYDRPTLPWEYGPPSNGRRVLSLFVDMDEEPPGLIAWFTVRNHRFSTGRHWRRGVFLNFQDHDALVDLTGPRELLLCVRGPSPDHFFSILRDGLEYLFSLRWPGLKYRLSVPCPGHSSEGCSGRFE